MTEEEKNLIDLRKQVEPTERQIKRVQMTIDVQATPIKSITHPESSTHNHIGVDRKQSV